MSAALLLALLLIFGVLTIWVPERWAWSLVQAGVFLLAGWRVLRSREFRLEKASCAAGLLALWPLLQLTAGASISRGETWLQLLNWSTYLAVFLLAASLLGEEQARGLFLRAVVGSGAAIAALAVAQYRSPGGAIFWIFPSGYADHVMGPFVNRNQFAAWVELLLPAALYLAATTRRGRLPRILCGVGAAVLLASVIAGASRAGSLLAVVEVAATGVVLVLRRDSSFRPARSTLLCAAALFALALAVVGWGDLHTRLLRTDSEPLRADAVRASFAMIRDRPWTGSGLGTWPILYPRYAGLDAGVVLNQAHNDWLQFAAEGGLPFLVLLLVFTAAMIRPAWRSIYGLGILAFLLHALVDYPMQQRPALPACFFAMAGAASAYGRASPRTTRRNTTSCA